MDLTFSDEQRFLRESVRGTLTREASFSTLRGWVLEGTTDHRAPHALAVRQGWTGIGIAEERGGQGGGAIELAILAEEIGRAALPADALYSSLLAAIALVGDERGQDTVFALADGEQTAAFVHPGDRPADSTGYEAGAHLVVGGAVVDLLIAWDGQALEIYDAAGQERTVRELVDRTRSVAHVALAGEPRARIDGFGPAEMASVAAHAALITAADALGACTRMLELTVEYVNDRVQFGKPVGSFQAVKHAAAEMLVAIEGTRGTVQYAAWALSAGEPDGARDAWVAKARSAHTATTVADKALFLHGAVGYTWEHDLQLLFKRAKSDAVMFGGPALYEDRIADSLELVPEAVLQN